MLSSEFCEISKNTFSYTTPPVVASQPMQCEIIATAIKTRHPNMIGKLPNQTFLEAIHSVNDM